MMRNLPEKRYAPTLWGAGLLATTSIVLLIGVATAGPPVATPRLGGDFHRGVNHAHIHRRGLGYGSPTSATQLAKLRRVGIDSIAITPFAYQRGAMSDRLMGFTGRGGATEFFRGTDPTMTDGDIVHEAKHAHDLGMRVVLKPHVWSNDFWDGGEWHGTIRQRSDEAHQRWWSSYRAFILHHARVAERSGIEVYCIGTEMVKMTTDYPHQWRQLIADVRRVYQGNLTYCAHHDRELDRIAFWEDLDYIGLSAYFPLDAPPGAATDQLVEAWRPHRTRLTDVSRRTGRPVLFLEVGYRPVTDTHRAPWRHTGGTLDLEAQRRAYNAMFISLSDASWWKGVYFWKTFTSPRRHSRKSAADIFTFQDRPAEKVVTEWFGIGE